MTTQSQRGVCHLRMDIFYRVSRKFAPTDSKLPDSNSHFPLSSLLKRKLRVQEFMRFALPYTLKEGKIGVPTLRFPSLRQDIYTASNAPDVGA